MILHCDWSNCHVTSEYWTPIGREPSVYSHLPYWHDLLYFQKKDFAFGSYSINVTNHSAVS